VSFGPAFKIMLSIPPSGVAPGRVLTTAPEVRESEREKENRKRERENRLRALER